MMVESCLDIMHRHHYSEWPTRFPEEINRIVIHRFRIPGSLPDDEIGAHEVADFFEKEPQWAGSRMPYHFVIATSGRCEQALELDVIGYHASGKNRTSVGIAMIGDFTQTPPTDKQVDTLFLLCRALDGWISPSVIERHRPVNDPVKDCPGALLDIEGLGKKIQKHRQVLTCEDAERRLVDIGVVV